ncbi:MAG TPA: cupin domain-containing protein [bacterium]|nr:cupin domain-containing protein [bacterium]
MTPEAIIETLGLVRHDREGGFFSEIYRSRERATTGDASFPSAHATSIYYLLTRDTFSEMHRLTLSDEVFHWYMGDPVEMLQVLEDGTGTVVAIGPDLAKGERPQVVVPKRVWQGSRLIAGGTFALLGTTVPFWSDFADYETGTRDDLMRLCPSFNDLIAALTRS